MREGDKVKEIAKSLASAIVREAVWTTYDSVLDVAERVIEQELDRGLRGEDGLFYDALCGEQEELEREADYLHKKIHRMMIACERGLFSLNGALSKLGVEGRLEDYPQLQVVKEALSYCLGDPSPKQESQSDAQ